MLSKLAMAISIPISTGSPVKRLMHVIQLSGIVHLYPKNEPTLERSSSKLYGRILTLFAVKGGMVFFANHRHVLLSMYFSFSQLLNCSNGNDVILASCRAREGVQLTHVVA